MAENETLSGRAIAAIGEYARTDAAAKRALLQRIGAEYPTQEGGMTDTGWRPIETAPRDRPILAVVDGATRVVRWGKTSHIPLYGWCLADQGAEEFDLCHPKLWQPLPELPTE